MGLLLNTISSFKNDSKSRYYWELFNLYKEWATNEWEVVLDETTVDHSISHTERIIDILDNILSGYDQNYLLEKFSPKYLVLLVCSAYTHDIGMQNYFHHRFPSLKKANYDFDIYDYEIIRQIHSDTIEEVFQRLSKDYKSIKYLKQKLSKIHNSDKHLYGKLKNLIQETAIELSLITSFHNKGHSLGELNISITKLTEEDKKLKLTEKDKSRLKCCVGLLQMADALDMSKNRILINNFIDSLNNYHTGDLDTIDIISIEKQINCYLIDDVEINYSKNELLIRIVSSYSSSKYHEHKELLESIYCKYNSRLTKSENDAVSITRCLLDFNISIDIPPFKSDSSKDPIPCDLVNFLTSLKPQHTDFVSILDQGVKNCIPHFVPTYSKLFNRKLGIFFGGASCNYDDNVEAFVNSLFFQNSDWNLDLSTEPYLVPSTKTFLRKTKRKTLKAYKKYLSINRYIKSEVFIPILYQANLIGFVNCHFQDSKTKIELSEFGSKIQGIINKTIAPQLILKHKKDSRKYFQVIESIDFLTTSEKSYMVSLYRSIFDTNTNMEIDCIVSDELTCLLSNLYSKYSINCEPFVEVGVERYLHINYKLLIKVLGIVTEELAKLFKMAICTQCNSKDIYYLIDYTFFDAVSFGGQTVNSIIDYLNSNSLLPSNTVRKTFNYPIVIKFLVNLFGGTISMKPIDNEYHLLIYLPTYATKNHLT